jgi:simple sugar transport system permease protein
VTWILVIIGIFRFAAPVAFAAIGETISEKSGLINIGIEGIMMMAAFTAALVSDVTGSPWLGLGAGAGVGLVMGAIQSGFVIKLAADQVVVGMGLNLLGIGLSRSLYRIRWGGADAIVQVPELPDFGGWADPVVLTLPFVAWGAHWLIFKCRWGLAARAAGEYPEAVESAGFSVQMLRFKAHLLGALLAGVGGAYLSLGISGSFSEELTAGRGFVAIALVTFGRWKPMGVLGAALLIGAAEQLQFWLQGLGLGVPHQLFGALPYVLALAVLAASVQRTRAPQALAQPYIKVK